MHRKLFKRSISTPIGFLNLTADDRSLLTLSFSDTMGEDSAIQPAILEIAARQLHEYFQGDRKTFKLQIDRGGSEFQRAVWKKVEQISYGKTVSYSFIAKMLGNKGLSRAVGFANGINPIPVIIPCHRIVGINNKLTGYSGGLDRKKWLLNHEFSHSDFSDIFS